MDISYSVSIGANEARKEGTLVDSVANSTVMRDQSFTILAPTMPCNCSYENFVERLT